VDAELVHVLKQSMVAPNETKTAAYTLTNVGYSYNFMGDRINVSAFFRLRNLFNVEARNHVSTLKDISPLPGRNAILGLTLSL
jgi:iron complex outermembrane receptor protein